VQEQTDSKRLAWHDGGYVRKKLGLDELPAFVSLSGSGPGEKQQKSEQERNREDPAEFYARIHGSIYHLVLMAATRRRNGSRSALILLMRKFLVIAVLAGLGWLFIVQKRNEVSKPATPATKPTAQASASPRPVSEHNWMKHSLDRANEVKKQVVEQRKTDGTR
jgi:hypothetical protein